MTNKRLAIGMSVIAACYFVLYLWTAILMDEWRALYFKCAGYHSRCVTESAMAARKSQELAERSAEMVRDTWKALGVEP